VSFPVERLREFRQERRLTQPALAAALNVGLRSIVRWELGESVPSPLALRALAEFFGERLRSVKRKAAR